MTGSELIKTLLLLVFLIALSLLMIGKPEWLWKIEHFLEVKGGEPTDLYLAVMRVMGTFLLIFSVGFLDSSDTPSTHSSPGEHHGRCPTRRHTDAEDRNQADNTSLQGCDAPGVACREKRPYRHNGVGLSR